MKILSAILITLSAIQHGCSNAAITYPVTDASQSKCYDKTSSIITCDSTTGQDAEYDLVRQEFCDNNDDTVTDQKTGLMWTKKLYGKMSITDAEESVTLASYSDWRLPTIKELYTLIQFNGVTGNVESENVPYINTNFFEVEYGSDRYIDGQIWSSTHYVNQVMDNKDCIFGLNLIDGRIKCYPTELDLFVRYVRGPTTIGTNSFENYPEFPNDIVVDQATGLHWMKKDSGFYTAEGLDWIEALDFCEELSLGGFTDWRLPDAHELQSIVDYSRSPDLTNSPSIDPIFESTAITNEVNRPDFGYYWTSDTHLDGILGVAVYVAFGRALGNFAPTPFQSASIMDVHGAGAQRSDPKVMTSNTPSYAGPQGDIIRVYNMVRCVRGISAAMEGVPECTPNTGGNNTGTDDTTDPSAGVDNVNSCTQCQHSLFGINFCVRSPLFVFILTLFGLLCDD